ncbi:MAG: PQQ-binding-like beta-propeller repeat protein, partial [Planctomycetes bacterium]|nr:PQQ-binding-like beta-propeller repeat protein [Planctomycetota bacterium]
GLVKFWQLRLPLKPQQRVADAYLVEDHLYLCTEDGYVFAVHADTGAIRWLRPVTGAGYRVKQPCHVDGQVVFTTPTTVLVVDRFTGKGLGKLELNFPAGTAAISDGARLYLGGINQRFYAFRVDNLFEAWKAGGNGPILGTPALYQGNLFLATDGGDVYSCIAEDKRFRWQSRTNGPNTADVIVDQNGVYVASRDHSLYLLDLIFGQQRWRARFSGPLYEAPVTMSEVVYQYCPDDGLIAVNTAVVEVDQRFRWKLPRGRKLLTVDRRYAYVLSRDESVLAVDNKDGTVVHTIPAPGLILPMPAPERATIFLASADGRIFCARPRGVPFVRREDLRQALTPPEDQETTSPELTQTAPATEQTQRKDYLQSAQRGTPLGGKSKVTREFESGAKAEGGEQ